MSEVEEFPAWLKGFWARKVEPKSIKLGNLPLLYRGHAPSTFDRNESCSLQQLKMCLSRSWHSSYVGLDCIMTYFYRYAYFLHKTSTNMDQTVSSAVLVIFCLLISMSWDWNQRLCCTRNVLQNYYRRGELTQTLRIRTAWIRWALTFASTLDDSDHIIICLTNTDHYVPAWSGIWHLQWLDIYRSC